MSRRKGEPVKNTCPDIDRIISTITSICKQMEDCNEDDEKDSWIFYMSEPKYVDNPQQEIYPNKFDIVSIPKYENEVELAMIIQVDTSSSNRKYATVKSITHSWDDFYRLETYYY